MIFCVSQEIG